MWYDKWTRIVKYLSFDLNTIVIYTEVEPNIPLNILYLGYKYALDGSVVKN